MITIEQFKGCEIPVKSALIGNAALERLKKNTTLAINMDDVKTVEALPFSAKLFISKYSEIMGSSSVVSSQSIEGLSQSFNQTAKGALIWQAAEELLSDYLVGRVRFVAATSKWK